MLRNTLIVFSLFLFASASMAQDARSLGEDQKADLVFEFRVDRFLDQSEKLGWRTRAVDIFLSRLGPPNAVVKAVRGASQLPVESKDGFNPLNKERELTFNFYIQLEFADAASCDIMETRWAAVAVKETVDGTDFYRLRDPKNLVGLRSGSKLKRTGILHTILPNFLAGDNDSFEIILIAAF